MLRYTTHFDHDTILEYIRIHRHHNPTHRSCKSQDMAPHISSVCWSEISLVLVVWEQWCMLRYMTHFDHGTTLEYIRIHMLRNPTHRSCKSQHMAPRTESGTLKVW